jgi:C-terminal processing protease CtpA/Prc
MYTAYAEGRTKKDPSEGWYGGEIWFFDNYVIPLATKLKKCGVFGFSSDEYLNYATQNRVEWEAKGQEVVETMRERVIAKLALKHEMEKNEDIPMEITMSSEPETKPVLESVQESIEEATEATDAPLRTVVAPAGKLGVIIDTTPGQTTMVHEVLENSPMLGMIKPGDQIVSIDSIPTSNMSTEAIAALLKSTAAHPRRFVIRRETE